MKFIFAIALLLSSCPAFAQHNDIIPTKGFTITGLVEHPLTFNISDLPKYKQEDLGEVVIRNHKGEKKGVSKGMKGILLKTFLDSAGVHADKPKLYGELYVVLTGSDGYKNVYSWSELSNTEIGNHIYVITAMDGQTLDQLPNRIEVRSIGDFNSGSRHLKALSKIEVKKVE